MLVACLICLIACFLACFSWLVCFALLAWFACLTWVAWLAYCLACCTWLVWFDRLAQNCSKFCYTGYPRTRVILKFWQTQTHRIFNLQGNPLYNWSWAWFFWRSLQEGNFEIFLVTLQLHRVPNPIWFCKCKLRYTVWEIWESQLLHIRFSASLKHLKVIPSSLPPSWP